MSLEEFLSEWRNANSTVLVHTSGSTGKPKPMLVEKCRMEQSARITCDFLGLKQGDTALLCMPLDYIAGKMMVVRSLIRNMRLISIPPSGHPLSDVPSDVHIDFAAMVPLQVYNSLQVPEECERLKEISHLIIGGGAVDDTVAEALSTFPNAVWSTYGMTETLSHIALRRLSGMERSDWYTPFESVALSQTDEGCLVIDAPLVCEKKLITNDIVEIASDGRFRVIGRKDNVVCSGGIKIQIEEVEKMLKPYIKSPFLITKRKDEKFGEAVVLLAEGDVLDDVKMVCKRVLPKLWQPRHYFSVAHLPFTETGKPARKEAERIATEINV